MGWLEIFNFVHFLGLVWGVGGATIATIISVKAGKDKKVAEAAGKIMPAIIKLIWLGLLFLIISGIALPFFISWPLNKQMLTIKHVLVAWIVIIGVVLGLTSKKIDRYAPLMKEKQSIKFLKARKQMKVFSIINLILWYAVTLLSAFV